MIAVVPAFHPEASLVRRLEALAGQVAAVVVVDDASETGPDPVLAAASPHATVVHPDGNRGIAAALNTGIAMALADGATHILTLDQDTDLPDDYVATALGVFSRADGTRVGAVVVDAVNGAKTIPMSTSAEGFGLVPEAIQTGMIVSAECLADAGDFDETLFIDCVDIEFCHRIRARGWSIAVAAGTDVVHAIGRLVPMRPFGILWRRDGAVRTYQWHPPFRQYYIVRNNLDLVRRYRRAETDWAAGTRITVGFESLRKVICGPRRLAQLIATWAGLWHAVRGRRGRIPARLERMLR